MSDGLDTIYYVTAELTQLYPSDTQEAADTVSTSIVATRVPIRVDLSGPSMPKLPFCESILKWGDVD